MKPLAKSIKQVCERVNGDDDYYRWRCYCYSLFRLVLRAADFNERLCLNLALDFLL